MKDLSKLNIAFFGTPQFAVGVLEELHKAGLTPSLIVTNPDRPKGRKMLLTPPPTKIWAHSHDVAVFQPLSLKDRNALTPLTERTFDLFIVAAYGNILPGWLLELPTHKTLNVHPSLLPKLRGASPVQSAILADMRTTGVSIMLIDEEMDHGPVIAQESVEIAKEEWPMRSTELETLLAEKGGDLLARTIPGWIAGDTIPYAQDHENATFCTKITKEMGQIDLGMEPYQNLLKVRAFDGWPGTFFFHSKKDGNKIRVKITAAEIDPNGDFKILSVVPEGKSEISYEDFTRNS
jgi:methionyl-tRNA formyltransferase